MLHLSAPNSASKIRLENTFDTPNNVWEIDPSIAGVANTGFTIRDVTDNVNRLVINGSGNVGIGTNSPNAILSVHTDQGGTDIGANHGTGGTYPKASGISFGATSTSLTVDNNGGTVNFSGGAGIYANNTAAAGNPTDLILWTNSTGTPSEKLRVTGNGKVGIGTTVPHSDSTLDVNGDIACDRFVPDYTATVNANWTTSTIIVPTGTLTTNSTYIVELRIGTYSGPPYYLYGSTLVATSSTNGNWDGNEVEIIAATHTGNGYSMYVRSYGATSTVSGIKLRVNSAGGTGQARDCVVKVKRIF
jgi:hypothetical protein